MVNRRAAWIASGVPRGLENGGPDRPWGMLSPEIQSRTPHIVPPPDSPSWPAIVATKLGSAASCRGQEDAREDQGHTGQVMGAKRFAQEHHGQQGGDQGMEMGQVARLDGSDHGHSADPEQVSDDGGKHRT